MTLKRRHLWSAVILCGLLAGGAVFAKVTLVSAKYYRYPCLVDSVALDQNNQNATSPQTMLVDANFVSTTMQSLICTEPSPTPNSSPSPTPTPRPTATPTATPSPTPSPTATPTPTPDQFTNHSTYLTVGTGEFASNDNVLDIGVNTLSMTLASAAGSLDDFRNAADRWNQRLVDSGSTGINFNIQPLTQRCDSHPNDNCITFYDATEFGRMSTDPTVRALTVVTFANVAAAQPYNPHNVKRFGIYVNLGSNQSAGTNCNSTGVKCVTTRNKYQTTGTGIVSGIPKPYAYATTLNVIASHELGHVLTGPDHNTDPQSIMSLGETMIPGRDLGVGLNGVSTISYWFYSTAAQGGWLNSWLPSLADGQRAHDLQVLPLPVVATPTPRPTP